MAYHIPYYTYTIYYIYHILYTIYVHVSMYNPSFFLSTYINIISAKSYLYIPYIANVFNCYQFDICINKALVATTTNKKCDEVRSFICRYWKEWFKIMRKGERLLWAVEDTTPLQVYISYTSYINIMVQKWKVLRTLHIMLCLTLVSSDKLSCF